MRCASYQILSIRSIDMGGWGLVSIDSLSSAYTIRRSMRSVSLRLIRFPISELLGESNQKKFHLLSILAPPRRRRQKKRRINGIRFLISHSTDNWSHRLITGSITFHRTFRLIFKYCLHTSRHFLFGSRLSRSIFLLIQIESGCRPYVCNLFVACTCTICASIRSELCVYCIATVATA